MKKIVSCLILMLMFCSTISTASLLKNENNFNKNETMITEPLSSGDTYLYPPWSHGSNWVGYTQEIAFVDGDASSNEYDGETWSHVFTGGAGHAFAESFITHNQNPNYVAPENGYYDFTFTYKYYGYLDIHVYIGLPPSDAYVDTDIVIRFNLKVMSTSDLYTKEVVLDEERHDVDFYTDWDNTKDVSFNDIYVPAGSEVFLSATLFVENFHAAAALDGASDGWLELHGKLKKIKVVEPGENQKPNNPTINGPSSGNAGSSYTYSFISSDPENDDIQYYIEWGDGTNTGWTLLQSSGSTCTKSHTWSNSGSYTIKAKVKDEYGAESDWSYFSISMPRVRRAQTMVFDVFQNHPMLMKILNGIFNK